MIVGGIVVETGLEKVVEGVKRQGAVAKRPTNSDSRLGGGAVSLASVGIPFGGRGIWNN